MSAFLAADAGNVFSCIGCPKRIASLPATAPDGKKKIHCACSIHGLDCDDPTFHLAAQFGRRRMMRIKQNDSDEVTSKLALVCHLCMEFYDSLVTKELAEKYQPTSSKSLMVAIIQKFPFVTILADARKNSPEELQRAQQQLKSCPELSQQKNMTSAYSESDISLLSKLQTVRHQTFTNGGDSSKNLLSNDAIREQLLRQEQNIKSKYIHKVSFKDMFLLSRGGSGAGGAENAASYLRNVARVSKNPLTVALAEERIQWIELERAKFIATFRKSNSSKSGSSKDAKISANLPADTNYRLLALFKTASGDIHSAVVGSIEPLSLVLQETIYGTLQVASTPHYLANRARFNKGASSHSHVNGLSASKVNELIQQQLKRASSNFSSSEAKRPRTTENSNQGTHARNSSAPNAKGSSGSAIDSSKSRDALNAGNKEEFFRLNGITDSGMTQFETRVTNASQSESSISAEVTKIRADFKAKAKWMWLTHAKGGNCCTNCLLNAKGVAASRGHPIRDCKLPCKVVCSKCKPEIHWAKDCPKNSKK